MFLIVLSLTMMCSVLFFDSPLELKYALTILLLFSTLWHDMVQATITASYCLQSQLLTSHLYFLRKKLLQHNLQPLDFMRVRKSNDYAC